MSLQVNKFENIQALRGIAVMLVVMFHLLLVEQRYGHGIMILPQLFNMGACGVDIFFVISGFVMVTITKGQFQKKNAATHFLAHRITRIYPLYWFYTLLILMVLLLHPGWVNQSPDHDYDYVRSFLLLPMSDWQILLVGWSLIHEMYFYLIMALLLFFPERYLPKLLGLWLVFIIVSAFCISSDSPTIKIITHPLTTEFIAGCFITRLLFINEKIPAWIILVTGSSLLMAGFACFAHFFTNQAPDGWVRIGLFGMPSFMLVYAGVALERNHVLFPRLLCKLGDASYSIYLGHVLVLSALGRIFALLPLHHIIIHIIGLIVMVMAVVVVGTISYRCLERPLMKFFRDKIKINFSLLNYLKMER